MVQSSYFCPWSVGHLRTCCTSTSDLTVKSHLEVQRVRGEERERTAAENAVRVVDEEVVAIGVELARLVHADGEVVGEVAPQEEALHDPKEIRLVIRTVVSVPFKLNP